MALLVAVLAPVSAHADDAGAGTLPRRELLDDALAAYHRVEQAGLVRTHLLTIIDYSLPASERRLWVIDADRLRVLFHELVAHGRGSATDGDPERAVWFGNDPSSRRSSLGTFLTGETYTGSHGHSLELVGLDPGVNDHAIERRIVIHPAAYVTMAHRARWGQIGRSWGCPALDPAVASAVIDTIQDGSVVYAAAAQTPPATPLLQVARDAAAVGSNRVAPPALTRHARNKAARTKGVLVARGKATRTSGVLVTRRRAGCATTGRRSSAASSCT